MHRSRLAVAVAFLAFAMYSPCIFATGNVLVPSDEDAPPAVQTPNASSDDSGADKPMPAAEAEPSSASKPAPAQNYTPVTSSMAAKMPSMTAQVVEMPDPAPNKFTAKTTLPYSLAIILPDHFQWGNEDMNVIQHTLGISPEEATQHCRLSASGALRTNGGQGFFTYNLGLAGNTLVPYDGYIQSMSLRLRALCDIGGPLPATGATVMRIADKYAVTLLTPVDCSPSSPQIRQALVQYNPNGTASCSFH